MAKNKTILPDPNPPKTLVRNSERKDFRSCQQRWWWRYVEHWDKPNTSAALILGTLVHLALEAWYLKGTERGEHPAEAFARLFDEWGDSPRFVWGSEDERYDLKELGIAMLEHYVEFWGEDTEWEVVAVERAFRMPIWNMADQKIGTQVGRVDLIVYNRVTDQFWLWDHKTAQSIDGTYLELDDQASGYLAAMEELLDIPLTGIIFNFLRKAIKDERPQNEKGQYLNKPKKEDLLLWLENDGMEVSRKMRVPDLEELVMSRGQDPALLGEPSKQQPPPYFERIRIHRNDYDKWMQKKRLADETRTIKLYRAGKLPVMKNPGRDCSWCPFFDVCVLHETGGEYEELLRTGYIQRDPYTTYKSLEEEYLEP